MGRMGWLAWAFVMAADRPSAERINAMEIKKDKTPRRAQPVVAPMVSLKMRSIHFPVKPNLSILFSWWTEPYHFQAQY